MLWKRALLGHFILDQRNYFYGHLHDPRNSHKLQELLGKFNGNKKAEKTTLWSVKIIREKLKEKEQQRKQNSV